MAHLVSGGLQTALDRRVSIEEYVIWSTIAAALLFVPVQGNLMLGYFVVIMNSMILLLFNRLSIHRNHVIVLLGIAGFSLIGGHSSGTTIIAIGSQILGIGVLSVYYFSMFTNFEIRPALWMEMYVRVAFVLAVLSVILLPVKIRLTGDTRLSGIYSEPSYYIYMTLPAVGYCISCYLEERRYGWETLVFLLTYALADSALGYLGLMMIALLAYAPRLRGWQVLAGVVVASVLAGGLYFASVNLRLRVNEFAEAGATQDLSKAGNSTFAFLSNVYVTSQSFLAHPLTGVGIGGYASAYDKYIGDIMGPLTTVTQQLNRDDANSMMLRVAAELGMPGLVLLFGFIIVCARVRGQPYRMVRNAILPYLLIRLGRMGHYFTTELYFFVGLYLLNYLNYRSSHHPEPAAPERQNFLKSPDSEAI